MERPPSRILSWLPAVARRTLPTTPFNWCRLSALPIWLSPKTAAPATFTAGQKGVVYTVTAANVGSTPSSGVFTVTDTLDPNLAYVSGTGSGWTCSATGQVVTCNTSAVIGAEATAPPITITVNVTTTAPATVTNKISIAGGGDVNSSNNSFQLVSNVVAPDLTVSKILNSGAFTRG